MGILPTYNIDFSGIDFSSHYQNSDGSVNLIEVGLYEVTADFSGISDADGIEKFTKIEWLKDGIVLSATPVVLQLIWRLKLLTGNRDEVSYLPYYLRGRLRQC